MGPKSPDGSNGAPITNYTIDLASPTLEVQFDHCVHDALFDDMIALDLDGARTRCLLQMHLLQRSS